MQLQERGFAPGRGVAYPSMKPKTNLSRAILRGMWIIAWLRSNCAGVFICRVVTECETANFCVSQPCQPCRLRQAFTSTILPATGCGGFDAPGVGLADDHSGHGGDNC